MNGKALITTTIFLLAWAGMTNAAPQQISPVKNASPAAVQGVPKIQASRIIMNDITTEYFTSESGQLEVKATLLDPNGKPLQNKQICWQYVKFGGKGCDAWTDINGVAVHHLRGTAVPGVYAFKAFFEGDANAPPGQHTCTLTITKARTRFDASKVKAVYHSNDPYNLAARLNLDIRGLVFERDIKTDYKNARKVPFVSFQIKWPGMTTAPITINTYNLKDEGTYGFKWTASGLPAPGQTQYQFTAEFAGTDKYAPSSLTFSIPFSSLTYEKQY